MQKAIKNKALQRTLLSYYESEQIRIFNLILFFIVEVILCIQLTLLPIKLTFNWILKNTLTKFNFTLDIIFIIIFALHIYLYLQNKLRTIIENPQSDRLIYIRSRRIKIRWLSIISLQLIYDLICLAVAIYQFNLEEANNNYNLIQYVYILQLYKIQIFRTTVQSYIIGTSFNTVYNVIEGTLIFIFFVSYVGCLFYQIDKTLLDQNYYYVQLLWIVSSAWDEIINSSLGIQILYTMYWSIGTASTAAYGNVSASSPYDVIYNVLCLYFLGFLFGFYISRFHSAPSQIVERQEQLLQIFHQFERHKQQIRKNNNKNNEKVQRQLYLKILCSLEYQDNFKQNHSSIEDILPISFKIAIKTHIFQAFLAKNPIGLFQTKQIQQKNSLNIVQAITQTNERIFNYKIIPSNALIYVQQGSVKTSIKIDGKNCSQCLYESGSVLNVYNFVTNILISQYIAKSMQFTNLYILDRKKYLDSLTIQGKVKFNELFNSIITGQNKDTQNQSIGKATAEMRSLNNPIRKANHINLILQKSVCKSHKFARSNIKSSKIMSSRNLKTKTIGIQCNIQISTIFQSVLLFN